MNHIRSLNMSKKLGLVVAIGMTLGSLVSVQGQSFLTNGLVGYYPFSGNANDLSGNGNNAVVIGATIATNRFGQGMDSYQFSGAGQVVTTTNNIGFPTSTNDFTVSVWCMFDRIVTNDYQIIVANKVVNAFQLNLSPFDASGGNIQFYTGGPSIQGPDCQTSRLNFQPNIWYQIVVVRRTNNVSILLNNKVESQSLVLEGNVATSTNRNLDFGYRSSNSNHPFRGQLDDIRIYNRALSSNEVASLYYHESRKNVQLVKSYTLDFDGLAIGTNYQLQVSTNLVFWTNWGSTFTATSEKYTNVIPHQRVDDWSKLFFRLDPK